MQAYPYFGMAALDFLTANYIAYRAWISQMIEFQRRNLMAVYKIGADAGPTNASTKGSYGM